MRVGFAITTVLFMAAGPLLHGQGAANADLSCVDFLELPTRGVIAAAAGTSGVVRAVAHIGEQGRLSSLELDGGGTRLQGEVRVAINLSQFASKCHDRTVEFVFAFTLQGPPTDSILPPGVRFRPPNRFELVFRQLKPIIEVVPSQSKPANN